MKAKLNFDTILKENRIGNLKINSAVADCAKRGYGKLVGGFYAYCSGWDTWHTEYFGELPQKSYSFEGLGNHLFYLPEIDCMTVRIEENYCNGQVSAIICAKSELLDYQKP